MAGDCNADGGRGNRGVLTTNFYSVTDTLLTGQPSFNGTRTSVQFSRLQFWGGYAVKSTAGGTGCSFDYPYYFEIRFRFASDSVADSLAGWLIDSIKIEHDYYPGKVVEINKSSTLEVFPNPSYNGTFIFPALVHEEQYSMEVYNSIGERVLKTPYKQSIDLPSYARGLYFYKVSDGTEYYSGRLLIE